MPIVNNAWHLISAAILFLVGFFVAISLARKFKVPSRRSLFLYVWHTSFSIVYLAYSLDHIADATTYYQSSLTYADGFAVGTDFVEWFTSHFTRGLGISYLGTFLLFNIFGFVGMLAFYGSIREAVNGKSALLRRLGFLIVMLPSISFWSSALGKDAVAFMATGLFVWGAIDTKSRKVSFVLSVMTMLLVRPHVAALMVTAVAASMTFGTGSRWTSRIVVGSIALLCAVLVVPFAVNYVGLGNASGAADIADYVAQRQSYNQEGGGGVDISSMSLPMQLFTYLFRPLPFEAYGLASFAASIDNLVLLMLIAIAGYKWLVSSYSRHRGALTLWLYSLSTWAVLSITTANLGIAVRQKWMFAPALIYLSLAAMGRARSYGGSDDSHSGGMSDAGRKWHP